MFDLIQQLNPLAITIITLIAVVFLLAFISTIVVRNRYAKISRDFHRNHKLTNPNFSEIVLTKIAEDYRKAAESNGPDVNTQAIIEKHFNNEHNTLALGERFVKQATSIMIILGLLGTFYGLTLSISELVNLLSNGGGMEFTNVEGVVTGLIDSVQGMSVAFVTSLFGITGSIVLTILSTFANIGTVRETLLVEVESYLDNVVAKDYSTRMQEEYQMLAQAVQQVFDRYGDQLSNDLIHLAQDSTIQLTKTTTELQTSSKALMQAISMFAASLETFSDNTRDLTEFNHHLKTNIERMNVSFADFTDTLKESTDNVQSA